MKIVKLLTVAAVVGIVLYFVGAIYYAKQVGIPIW
jgi:hypothetical protein